VKQCKKKIYKEEADMSEKIDQMPETKKFLLWLEQEKTKELVGVHFFRGNIRRETTQEDFFRELNLINDLNASGKEISRMDVF